MNPISEIFKFLQSKNVENFPKTEEEFARRMAADSKLSQNVYGYLSKQNVENFPSDYNVFMDKLGFKKKVDTIQNSSVSASAGGPIPNPAENTAAGAITQPEWTNYPNMVAGNFNEILATIPKFIGAVDESLWNNLLGQDGYESPATRLGHKISKEVGVEALPNLVPEEKLNSIPGQVAQGIGQVGSMLMTGGGSAAPNAFAKAPTLWQVSKNLIKSPATIQGAAQSALPEYDAAKAAGLPEDEQFGVLAKNLLVGATENLALQRYMGRLNNITGGTPFKKMLATAGAMTAGGLEEATQEGIQNTLTNQIAKGSYDPDRDPFWNLAQSMAVGGIIGFILPGIGAAMRTAPPVVRSKIQDKVDELKQLNKDPETLELTPEKQQIIDKAMSGDMITNEEADILLDRTTPNAPEGDLGASNNTTIDAKSAENAQENSQFMKREQNDNIEQPVDQKSGSIVPRFSELADAKIDQAVLPIKDELLKAGKITTAENGNVTAVKQNSGESSQLYQDLKEITGDSNVALNEYLKIKQDGGDFKNKFGDWENSIMKEYGRAGNEYSIRTRKSAPQGQNKNAFAWTRDENGKLIISFNQNKVSRQSDFQQVKKSFEKEQVKGKEYKELYDKNINKLRDLKLHLIHMALIEKSKGEITEQDKINSLKEIGRLNGINLAKDYYGEPMIFMHGGAEGITRFKKPGDEGYQKSDKYTGSAGLYFSRRPKFALKYAQSEDGSAPGKGKDIYYTMLRTKNPYYVTDPRAQADYKIPDSKTLTTRDVEELKKKGYDSVIWDRENGAKHEVIVFEPDQVEIIGSYKNGLKNKTENSLSLQSHETRAEQPTNIDEERYNPKNSNQTQKTESTEVGKRVKFSWLGDDSMTGTFVGYDEASGSYDIKGDDGTIYPVKKESISPENSVDLTKKIDELGIGGKKPTPKNKPKNGPITTAQVFPVLSVIKGLGKAWDAFNRAQKLTFGRTFQRLEDWAAKKVQKGVQHNNAMMRMASQSLRNIIGGLPYTQDQIVDKRQFLGNKNFGHLRAKEMAKSMYGLIDSDIDALARVHSVLDSDKFKNTALAGMTYAHLNDKEKALFDDIRKANDFIHEWSHNNKLISDEVYDENKGKYIARLYEKHEFIPDDVEREYQKSRADLGMFKKRGSTDEDLLQDPVYATAKRMAQIMQTQAIFDYADQVNNAGLGKTADGPGLVQLGKPGDPPYYGSLTGKFVPSYVAEDFKGYFFMNKFTQDAFNLFRKYDRNVIRQFLKKSVTVFNPVVQLGNFMANVSFAFNAGVDPVSFIGNIPKAIKEIREKGPIYQQAVKEGLIKTDLLTSDMTPLKPSTKGPLGFFGRIAEAINEKTKIGDAISWLDQKAQDVYSGTDDVSKLSAYLTLKDTYGRSDKDATEAVYEGFQNYATVGKAFDFASKTPVIGNPFIKFKADLGRIIKNASTRRPLTTAAYLGFLYAAANMWFNDDDEDIQNIRANRAFIPKILGIPLVWQIPGIGEVNVARFAAPYYVYDKGANDNMIAESTDWLPYQWSPSPNDDSFLAGVSTTDPLIGPYIQIAADRDFRGKSIWDPEATKYSGDVATPEERTQNAINYLVRSQIPLFGRAQDMVAAYNGEPDTYGRTRDVKQAILNNIIKVQEFGEEQAKQTITDEVNFIKSNIDGLTREIAQLTSIYKRNVQDIQMNTNMTQEQKQKQIKKEYDLLLERRATKLEKQAQLMRDIQDPVKLMQKLLK